MSEPLLAVHDLAVRFPVAGGVVEAVRGVSFDIAAGERIGIVGESGAGKTVTGLAILGLVARPPAQVSGEVRFRGTDLLTLGRRKLRHVRGVQIATVFQDPVSCLNPTMRIGDQIVEAFRAHRHTTKAAARERAVELLGRVGLPAPRRRVDDYAHQLSGGMAQRVMIAMAIACDPALLIADEPTTALDVTIEAQIIDLLAELCAENGTAVMLITHDLGVLARFAERILVMYAGRIVEQGPVERIYYAAQHPYTWGLMTSVTRVDEARRRRLTVIGGAPPSVTEPVPGCAFHPRCAWAEERCRRERPLLQPCGDGQASACHFAGELPAAEALQQGRG